MIPASNSTARAGAPARAPVADDTPGVHAAVNYLVPPASGRHRVEVVPLGQGQTRRTGSYASTSVYIRDDRLAAAPATLDGRGFALGRQRTRVSDFNDDEQVRGVYYPEMTELVRRETGAREVLVFDHNLRVDSGDAPSNSRVPVRSVHNDYTEKSGPQRVRDLVGGQRAEALLERRFAIVNVWRSIEGVVQTSPLAVVDAGSVAPADLVPTDLAYPDRVGEIYEVAANPAHEWHYFSGLDENEVLFLKGYDSRRDVARFTPHTAIDVSGTPVNAPPRKSIEVRTLVFW